MFLIVDKLQYGQLPIVVLKRIDDNGICKITVAEGIVIPVTKVLADEVLKLYQTIDENDIEIDIEDAHNTKVNLYYGL
jgi:hypothetical protein